MRSVRSPRRKLRPTISLYLSLSSPYENRQTQIILYEILTKENQNQNQYTDNFLT